MVAKKQSTCIKCAHTGKGARESGKSSTKTSCADVAAKGAAKPHADTEDMEVGTGTIEPANHEQQNIQNHGQAPQRGTNPD